MSKQTKRFTSLLLAGALCVSPLQIPNISLTASAETKDTVIYSENYDDQTPDLSGWETTYTDTNPDHITNRITSEESYTGGSYWNLYSSTQNTITNTKTYDVTEAGTYELSFTAIGENVESKTLTLSSDKANSNPTPSNIELNAWASDWGNSGTPTVATIEMKSPGTITATMNCSFNAGGYINFDNFVLTKKTSTQAESETNIDDSKDTQKEGEQNTDIQSDDTQPTDTPAQNENKDVVDDNGKALLPVYSEDYSKSEKTDWESTWAEGTTGQTDQVDGGTWSTWSPNATTALFTHSFGKLEKGDYVFSFIATGGKMNTSKATLNIGDNEESTDITINAWDAKEPVATKIAFTIDTDIDVNATINANYAADGWLKFDNVTLAKEVDVAAKKAADLTNLGSLIEICDKLESSNYTKATWSTLSDALTNAKQLTEDSTMDDIATGLKTLKKAYNQLISANIFVNKVDNLSEDFIRGVDISSYVVEKQSGVTFKDEDGNELNDTAFFKLLKDSGINYVRVRIWNDPYTADGKGYGGGNNDLEKAKTIGKLAADAGIKTLIDFHYSDFWADPSRQYAPKAWRDYSVEQKEEALYTYTKESLTALLEAGVDVGMVQVGNETNNGIAGVDHEKSWEDMCRLFSAGSKAIREVATTAEKTIQVAVHFTDPQTPGYYEKVTNELENYNVDYDIFASSYYPNIHGSMENLTEVLNQIAKEHNKKVMVAETSWAWTTKDGDGHGQSFDRGENSIYNISVQGQATVIRNVVDAVNKVKDHAGIGVFYWEPTWLPVQYAYDENGIVDTSIAESNAEAWENYGSGWASSYSEEYDPEHGGKYYGGSVKDNESFFDFEGNPLPTLTIFKDIYNGREASSINLEAIKNPSLELSLDTPNVTEQLDAIKKALPATVVGVLNNSANIDMNVTWDENSIDTTIKELGSYTIKGTATGTYTYKEKPYEFTEDTTVTISLLPINLLKNGDFETKTSDNWTVSNENQADLVWNDTPYRGAGAMHFYSSNELAFSISQDVTVNDNGTYGASMVLQGGDGSDTDDISITVTNKTTNKSVNAKATLSGWNVWQLPKTEELAANKGDVLTVAVSVKAAARAWGSIDDVFLYRTDGAPTIVEPTEPTDDDVVKEDDSKKSDDSNQTNDSKKSDDSNQTNDSKKSDDSNQTNDSKKSDDSNQTNDSKKSDDSKKVDNTNTTQSPTTTTAVTPTTQEPATTNASAVVVRKVTKPVIKSKKKNQVTITWKKAKSVTGYEITYSTSKKFKKSQTKSYKVKKATLTKATLQKLKSGKKYFIKIRAYITKNGKTTYSKYTKVKTVVVK